MYILGIHNTVHDSSACLLQDGNIVAAAEEERFNREKHSGAFPTNAITYCLNAAGISLSDLDAIGVSYKPSLVVRNALAHAISLASPHISPRARLNVLLDELRYLYTLLLTRSRLGALASDSVLPKVFFIEHHLAHAASAFLVSPYERAAILTIDGYGEDTSTLLAVGQGDRIREIGRVRFPSSIGLLYNAITEYLGFQPDSDEGKVMALAAYGRPRVADFFRRILVWDANDWWFRSNLRYLDHSAQRVSREFIKIMGPHRSPDEGLTEHHADIAASLQAVVEEAGINLVRQVYSLTGLNALCMAGGVALNCVMNGKIVSGTPFEHFFFQPAAGDAGTAVGCATYIYHCLMGYPRSSFVMDDVYLGPAFDNEYILNTLKANNVQYEFRADIAETSAKLLADGKILGWFQGRMEFGPRALGNRSILADPRNPATKDAVNLKVKGREPFRPLGPSVKVEAVHEFFECCLPLPFMIVACPVRPDKIGLIPSVVHVDGTARIQTVSSETNPLFWQLLDEFEKLTRIPLLLNTSFNRKGEPIVCKPKDAVQTFLSIGLDYLAIGNYLVWKS
jgi:carbamoyltransferase